MADSSFAPEFSRPVAVKDLPQDGALQVSDKADAHERARIADRLGVVGVKRFGFSGALTQIEGGVRARGVARARLIRTCVVSLEDFDEIVEQPFQRDFILGVAAMDTLDDLDPEAEDPPEPLADVIDSAEIAVETVALSLDPYPRRPGAAFDGAVATPAGASDSDEKPNPFAGLAALKGRMGGETG